MFNYEISLNVLLGGYVCDRIACNERIPNTIENNPDGTDDGKCLLPTDSDDYCFAFNNSCYSTGCPEHSVESSPNSRICNSLICEERTPNRLTNSCGIGKNDDMCGYLDGKCVDQCPSSHYTNIDGVCVLKPCNMRQFNNSADLVCGEGCLLSSSFDSNLIPFENGNECLLKCDKSFQIGNSQGICYFTDDCNLREFARSEEYWCGIECWFSLGVCSYSCDSNTETEGINRNCVVKDGIIYNVVSLGGDNSVDQYNCGIGNNVFCKSLQYTIRNRFSLVFLNYLSPIISLVGTVIFHGIVNITGFSVKSLLA
jgi:hypothetical protein